MEHLMSLFVAVKEVAVAVGTLLAGGSAAYAVVKGLPILRDRTKLVHENIDLRELLEKSRETAQTYKAASDGWQSTVEQLGSEIKMLERKVDRVSHQLTDAVTWIVDAHIATRERRELPPLPESLADTLDKVDELRRSTDAIPLPGEQH
jgi:predicted RNase H-like nuclease (RuvC/YqgF family)